MNILGDYVTTILPDGTVSWPGLGFFRERGLGLYRKVTGGASALSICQNGVDVMTFSSSGASTSLPFAFPGNTSPVTFGDIKCTSITTNPSGSTPATNTAKFGSLDVSAYMAFRAGPTDVMDIGATILPYVPIQMTDGSNTAPSLTFANHGGSGIYSGFGGPVNISVGLTQKASFTSSSGISFLDNISAGTKTLACGAVTCGALTSSGKLTLPLGNSTAPSLTFTGFTSSGMYSDFADRPTITNGGGTVPSMIFDTASTITPTLFVAGAGSATVPPLSLGSGTNTGWFNASSPATESISTTVNGTEVERSLAGSKTFFVPISAGTNAISSVGAITSSGTVSCTGLTLTGNLTMGSNNITTVGSVTSSGTVSAGQLTSTGAISSGGGISINGIATPSAPASGYGMLFSDTGPYPNWQTPAGTLYSMLPPISYGALYLQSTYNASNVTVATTTLTTLISTTTVASPPYGPSKWRLRVNFTVICSCTAGCSYVVYCSDGTNKAAFTEGHITNSGDEWGNSATGTCATLYAPNTTATLTVSIYRNGAGTFTSKTTDGLGQGNNAFLQYIWENC